MNLTKDQFMSVSKERNWHGLYSHSLPDQSKEHGLEPSDTPTADHCTVPDRGSPGSFSSIHHSLVLTYFSFALLCIVTLRWNILGPGGSRKEATGGDGGEGGAVRGRAAEDGRRKSVEDGPNVPIHAEFCIEYGSTFATATDAIPFTSATHNYSCESLDTLISPIKYLTYF